MVTVPSADTVVRADWIQYQYQAIINQTSGGTLSINGNTGTQYIDVGATIEVYVTPDIDYKLVKLIANDGSETDITNSLKYIMKSHDVTFTATWGLNMNTVTLQPPSFTEFSTAGATYVDTIKNAYNSITYNVTISKPVASFTMNSTSSAVRKLAASGATIKIVKVPDNLETRLGSFAKLYFDWKMSDCRYNDGTSSTQMTQTSDGIQFIMPAGSDVTTQCALTTRLQST